ncbi:MAG: hypothetical protein CL920_32510 [Deltaproteobacteria bacterium]|nr:hypothetical protein [Deltaproteobacteria bacterium]|tara:strand:- start:432 stop:650 length:219 start_codon:yes stop_codon:yes gene_type:complete
MAKGRDARRKGKQRHSDGETTGVSGAKGGTKEAPQSKWIDFIFQPKNYPNTPRLSSKMMPTPKDEMGDVVIF